MMVFVKQFLALHRSDNKSMIKLDDLYILIIPKLPLYINSYYEDTYDSYIYEN